MTVEKRPGKFKQPQKAPRGNPDPASAPGPRKTPDRVFGMDRADPHDPYVKRSDRGGRSKNFIDGFGHKGD